MSLYNIEFKMSIGKRIKMCEILKTHTFFYFRKTKGEKNNGFQRICKE